MSADAFADHPSHVPSGCLAYPARLPTLVGKAGSVKMILSKIGRAEQLTRDYIRRGTSTLFAALAIAYEIQKCGQPS